MLDFRDRLSEIAVKKQDPDKLEKYVFDKIGLKKVVVDFLENLLSYFETLSKDDILFEREIEIELYKTSTYTWIFIKDKDREKTVKGDTFSSLWEAEYIYDFIKRKFESAEYLIKKEQINEKGKSFYVKIKP